MTLLHFVWSIDPEAISIGIYKARWYGLLFGVAFMIGYYIYIAIYKKEKANIKEADTIFIYTAIGAIVGARLGHILFYDLQLYLDNPIEMLYIWHGGLASHGGAIGILVMMYIYTLKDKSKTFLWLLDRLLIPVALGCMFIRFGNFFNSEIIGKPTDLPWGIIFLKNLAYTPVPRHPSQLYEALSYLLIFIFLWKYYTLNFNKLKEGAITGLFFILMFSARFIIEFTKENQSDFENGMSLNMGQLLSILPIIIGFWLFFRKDNKQPFKTK